MTPPSVLHGLERTPGARASHSSARIDEPSLRAVAQACGYDAQSVSQHFGVSLRHLRRWFRAHLDSSPGVWLAEQRLLHARRLLATSSSVKDVAYSVGFKQLSQFSRDFKRRFGHRPSTELVRTQPSPAPPPEHVIRRFTVRFDGLTGFTVLFDGLTDRIVVCSMENPGLTG